MLISAIKDNNPILFLEHRWLHDTIGYVPSDSYCATLDKANVVKYGLDITLVGVSYMTLECIKAAETLDSLGISVEVIDLRSINPLDIKSILESVAKTKRLLVVDHAEGVCGIASEIISSASQVMSSDFLVSPQKICFPSHPVPTSHQLSKDYYHLASDISEKIGAMLGQSLSKNSLFKSSDYKDQPNKDFKGPF